MEKVVAWTTTTFEKVASSETSSPEVPVWVLRGLNIVLIWNNKLTDLQTDFCSKTIRITLHNNSILWQTCVNLHQLHSFPQLHCKPLGYINLLFIHALQFHSYSHILMCEMVERTCCLRKIKGPKFVFGVLKASLDASLPF